MTLIAQRNPSASKPRRTLPRPLVGAMLVALALGGCQVSELAYEGKHLAPIPTSLERKIERMGMSARSPIMVQIFKEENALEVWKRDDAGSYKRVKTYEICAWSGKLGPKLKEGDRQAPEGFYTVSPAQMNPNSSYHLSFNIGFPNSFDLSHGRTGSHLMVHGDCSSRGCYAMEDLQIQEIYALAREAFRGGQQAFQLQAFPFRMTPENMARHADSPNLPFWEMLKEGADHFEVTGQPPRVDVCGKRYVFNAKPVAGSFSAGASCPTYDVPDQIETLVAAKTNEDLAARQKSVAKAAARGQREDRWEDREKAIATFFEQSRSGEQSDAPEADAPAASGTVEASSNVPIPRRAPSDRKPPAQTNVAANPAKGLQRLNPFARRNAPVASVAGVTEQNVTPTQPPSGPVAVVQAEPREADDNTVAPAEPLGYAPADEEGGLLSGIAKGSRGLFRRAGSIFN